MFKLSALVFRSLVVASLCGSAVACTAEITVPEGLGSKVSDAIDGKKGGHDGGTTAQPDGSAGDSGVAIPQPDASAGDSGTDDYGDAGVWGDDDDSSSDGGIIVGFDASAWGR